MSNPQKSSLFQKIGDCLSNERVRGVEPPMVMERISAFLFTLFSNIIGLLMISVAHLPDVGMGQNDQHPTDMMPHFPMVK
jgi:hypothetical protein